MLNGGSLRALPDTMLRNGSASLIDVINTGKMRLEVTAMSEHSPAGTSHSDARRRRRANPEYARIESSLAPYEQVARIIIRHRMALGITQEQLAKKVGTSNTAISRLESGRHPTKPETLSRIAAALGMRFVMGFESGPEDNPVRELVSA